MEPAKQEVQKAKYLPVPPGTIIRYYGWPMGYIWHHRHHGVVTCVSRIIRGRLWIGLAWCSPKDQFSRKKGRTLAIDRLYDDPIIIPFLYSPLRAQEELIAALCTGRDIKGCPEFVLNPNQLNKVPSWARKWFRWFARERKLS